MEGGIRQENTKLLVGQLDVTLFITIKLLLSKTKYSPPATKLIKKMQAVHFDQHELEQ